MSTVKVTIDGITVEVSPAATVLEAAKVAGVDIPYFCYHPHLKPAGLCRMCLVEIEGMPKLAPACVTQVRDGMVVYTKSDKVRKAQEGVIEFQLLHHPLDCPICDQAGECALQDITFRYGKATSRFIEEKELYPTKFYGPLIVHEQSRCILCKRCVRFSTEVMGGADWNVYWRAAHSIIGAYEKDVVANYFTANLVEVCPVGAITSRLYRYKTRIWKLEFSESVCPNCELACSVDLGVRENRLYKVKHNNPHPTPWMCDKAYFAFDYVNHSERIVWTLKREGDKMVSVSSSDAVSEIASRLSEYRGKIGFVVDASVSFEDALKVRALAEALECRDCDYRVYGEDYLPLEGSVKSLSDIESARAVAVFCGDVGISHPVLALSMAKAKMAGTKVAVVSSFDTYLGERATEYIVPLPSKEADCVEALLDGSYRDDLGVDKSEFERVLEIVKEAEVFVVGTRANAYLRDRIKGFAEGAGKKVLFLNTGSNALGMCRAGLFSEGVGNILEKVKAGELKALFVFNADLFNTYPNRELVKEALESVEFMVVSDVFFTDTASYADFFLPAATFAEADGTVFDLFGNERKRKRVVVPTEDVKDISAWIELIADAGEISLPDVQEKEPSVAVVEKKAESLGGKGLEALVVFPFYRSALYSNWCSKFSEVSSFPVVHLSLEDASRLGVSKGDKVVVESSGLKFEFEAALEEFLPEGACVLEAGFDRFPVTALLKGSWLTKVEIKKA